MFWYFIDTAAYHDFGQYEPSFPSIKELHGFRNRVWKVVSILVSEGVCVGA